MSQTDKQQCTLLFSATDTLFFKESRPMDATGELQSIFPPSMRTLTGVIRHWIGAYEGINWKEFKQEKNKAWHKMIGDPNQPDDLGQLHFTGCWIHKENQQGEQQRLYPAPLHLMQKENKLFALQISEQGYYCDLGKNIRLAQLPHVKKEQEDEVKGSKPLANTWIDAETLTTILHANIPPFDSEHFFSESDLLTKESRIGIVRDVKTGTVIESMLYQTQHLRLSKGVSLAVDVTGLPLELIKQPGNRIIRLGGEGRMAHLSIRDKTDTLPCFDKERLVPEKTKKGQVKRLVEKIVNQAKGVMIYLLTPLLIYQNKEQWQPLPNFTLYEGKTSHWRGELQGKDQRIKLILHSAITGKMLQQGGWDAANHCPRKMQSFIPTGSVFYCESEELNLLKTIEQLHGSQMGELQHYGYGQIAVGIWK
jgi:CRISPR-associated protein Cmr3